MLLEGSPEETPPPGGEVAKRGEGGKLTVLFTGQGSQRAGMGLGLYEAVFPCSAMRSTDMCPPRSGALD